MEYRGWWRTWRSPILSNLLFMAGLSFVCGGLKNVEHEFNGDITHMINTSLLLASLGMVVPIVSHFLTEVLPGKILGSFGGGQV